MVLGVASALVAAVCYGVASILQATGSRKAASPEGLDAGLIGRLLSQPAYLGSLGLTLFGFLFHLYAVRVLPLFLAQTGIAVSLVVTALLAVRIFGEHLTALEWVAVGAVFVGLSILGAAAGQTGTSTGEAWLGKSLFGVLAVMIVLGLAASRLTGAVAAATLGLLGGFGYAVVGVSARILPSLGLHAIVTSAATYSLGLGGALAFLLYSVALQRGAVTAATVSLISTQTIVPSVVGVVFLDDQVRSGWWPVAIFGFLMTAVAAVTLVRFEGSQDLASEPHGPERAPELPDKQVSE